MNPDFEVDTESLHQDATAIAALAGRVSGTVASAPAGEAAPHWSATAAAGLATDSVRHLVQSLGHDTADAATRVEAAARAYRQADARAAARLSGTAR